MLTAYIYDRMEAMMAPTHFTHALALAHARGCQLRAQAAAERLREMSPRRQALAEHLRRAADRLDPTRLARTPVGQS
jgi:hypothetical protein